MVDRRQNPLQGQATPVPLDILQNPHGTPKKSGGGGIGDFLGYLLGAFDTAGTKPFDPTNGRSGQPFQSVGGVTPHPSMYEQPAPPPLMSPDEFAQGARALLDMSQTPQPFRYPPPTTPPSARMGMGFQRLPGLDPGTVEQPRPRTPGENLKQRTDMFREKHRKSIAASSPAEGRWIAMMSGDERRTVMNDAARTADLIVAKHGVDPNDPAMAEAINVFKATVAEEGHDFIQRYHKETGSWPAPTTLATYLNAYFSGLAYGDGGAVEGEG